MKKYDSYADSGVEWLGDIPFSWDVKRVKDISITKSGTTPQSGNSKYYENGIFNWIRTTDLNDGELFEVEYKITQLAIDECRLNFLPINTILVAMYGGFGTIGKNSILKKPSTINQSVCAVLPSKKLCSLYFMYYLKYFRSEWKLFADGARKDPNINQDAIKNLFILYPPLPEQAAIAQYLDTKTKAIDRKVILLEKKIGFYKELRKSIINETVTKGLDKSVKLKDSGIDWIGQIPEHWEVKRIKDIFSSLAGGTPSTKEKEYWIGEIPWIPSGKVQNNIVIPNAVEEFISVEALKESSTKMAKANSILIALTGATCSNIGYLTFDTTINQSIVALLPKQKLDTKYYFNFLISGSEKIRTYMTGGAQGGINQEDVKFLKVLLPPINEQIKIATYLDHKTQTIDKIVGNIQSQITTLKELRKTLINDVVTGKIKVVE